MIGLNNGSPYYYKFPGDAVNQLWPFGDLKDYIIVGIKERQLQIVSSKYEVHYDLKTSPLKRWSDVMNEASKNPATKPTHIKRTIKRDDCFGIFYGWKHSHRWAPGTPHKHRRIHVFYRPVREETASARIKKHKNGTPINYINVEKI